MKTEFTVMKVSDIIKNSLTGRINPDPISQRPPVSTGFKKSQGIIEALLNDYGVGMITVRDISNDHAMKLVYPNSDYLIIDGGHRVRSLKDFYNGLFKVNGKSYSELESKLANQIICAEIIQCTSQEAIKIFQTRNKTTDVNFIEMVMCDDQSQICREVRSRVMYYKEYGNTIHPLFDATYRAGNFYPRHFDSDVNPRRKWDEYLMVAILKILGNGNVDAGQREIEKLIADEYLGTNPLNKKVLKTLDRFLDCARSFADERGRKFSSHTFAAFQVIWFGLYEKSNDFIVSDMEKFANTFMRAYTLLTSQHDLTYSHKTVMIDDMVLNLKEYVRNNIKNFSNSKVQHKCFDFFMEEMGSDFGVIFREGKRTVSAEEREAKLSLQGYKCAIDGETLRIEDSVWGHDTPWSKGGRLDEGCVIRKSHNVDMGAMSLSDYRMFIKMRDSNNKVVSIRKKKVG